MRRCNRLFQFYQIIHLNHLSHIVFDIDGSQVNRRVSLLSVNLTQYLVLLAIHIEVTHTLTTKCVLQGLTDITRTNAKHCSFIPIDNNPCFRFGEFQIYIRHTEIGTGIHSFEKWGDKLFKLLNIRSLKYILDRHS